MKFFRNNQRLNLRPISLSQQERCYRMDCTAHLDTFLLRSPVVDSVHEHTVPSTGKEPEDQHRS